MRGVSSPRHTFSLALPRHPTPLALSLPSDATVQDLAHAAAAAARAALTPVSSGGSSAALRLHGLPADPTLALTLGDLKLHAPHRLAVAEAPPSLRELDEPATALSDAEGLEARIDLRARAYASYRLLRPLDGRKATLVLDVDGTLVDTAA